MRAVQHGRRHPAARALQAQPPGRVDDCRLEHAASRRRRRLPDGTHHRDDGRHPEHALVGDGREWPDHNQWRGGPGAYDCPVQVHHLPEYILRETVHCAALARGSQLRDRHQLL